MHKFKQNKDNILYQYILKNHWISYSVPVVPRHRRLREGSNPITRLFTHFTGDLHGEWVIPKSGYGNNRQYVPIPGDVRLLFLNRQNFTLWVTVR